MTANIPDDSIAPSGTYRKYENPVGVCEIMRLLVNLVQVAVMVAQQQIARNCHCAWRTWTTGIVNQLSANS